MAKPLAHTRGSSMHIHQSVVERDSGRNVFSDEAGEPTAAFRHFIGGQQAGMADFTALFAPNVNSYQRLCHPYASPNNACWSHDNRSAGRSEEHTSELQSLMRISYAVFCLKKKNTESYYINQIHNKNNSNSQHI